MAANRSGKERTVDILVNGEPLALDIIGKGNLGEALAAVDELLETAGKIIVGLKIDGKDLDPADYPRIKDSPIGNFSKVEIGAESLAAIKVKALSTLLELVALSAEAAAAESSADWPSLASGLGELAEAFAGLFSSDELSFVQGIAEEVAKAAGSPPGGELRSRIAAQAERVTLIFKERLAEIEDPENEFRKASALYAGQAGELKEVPVLLQTGKDERAMKAVLLFIEIFNKVIRLVPELGRHGLDTASLKVGGEELPAFYASFNDILKRLSSGFEDRDSVLIGDLAEYEVAPRMAEFLAAIEGALAAK
jgi:hypothetical protein